MDSVWFAVDADGHVAAFVTGEDGHIPSEGNGGYGWEVLEEMEKLTGRSEEEEVEQQCTNLGLFCYDFGDSGDPVEPYTRMAVPTEPLHVEQLPPTLRQRVGMAAFPAVCFLKAERIQPFETYPECDGFSIEDQHGYLCADGKTVKPIPGAERYFHEWVEDFREQYPQVAARYHFDFSVVPEAGERAEEADDSSA
jgi:hypothetical protein